jgi:hypothetical protein
MSDCLAFEGMTLFQKLEAGISAPGLRVFGDNAYLNTPYMATPYASVSGVQKTPSISITRSCKHKLNVPLEDGQIGGQYSEAQYRWV